MRISLLAALSMICATPATAQSPIETQVEAPGPDAALKGTMLRPAGGKAPIVLIVPGSGPTDRDGNNPLGVKAAPYRLLAEALGAHGIGSVRIDKRGMFGSKGAIPDANKVTVADYAADVHAWVGAIREATGSSCIWVLGHSEGGLVALKAAQDPAGMCGVILATTGGRPIDVVLREQLAANPANAPLLADAYAAIDTLKAGKPVDASALPAPLQGLFPPQVQGYWIDLLTHDPAALAAALRIPTLIVEGERDIQITAADARALKTAQPKARLVMLPGVNHVLKMVSGEDRAANLATYADSDLPIAPGVVEAVAEFVKGVR